jgi:hypothetical protein
LQNGNPRSSDAPAIPVESWEVELSIAFQFNKEYIDYASGYKKGAKRNTNLVVLVELLLHRSYRKQNPARILKRNKRKRENEENIFKRDGPMHATQKIRYSTFIF